MAPATPMIVLLKRRQDGRFDIYRPPGRTLDPEHAQVGGELGAWVEADIDPARFDISHDGVDVDVCVADLAGRVVQVRIDDHAITTGRLPGPGCTAAGWSRTPPIPP